MQITKKHSGFLTRNLAAAGAVGILSLSLAGCVYDYDPYPPAAPYNAGYVQSCCYSYYDYPPYSPYYYSGTTLAFEFGDGGYHRWDHPGWGHWDHGGHWGGGHWNGGHGDGHWGGHR